MRRRHRPARPRRARLTGQRPPDLTQPYDRAARVVDTVWHQSADGRGGGGGAVVSDGTRLEAFTYTENASRPPLELTVGNDLPSVGVKHFSFTVDDLHAARADLIARGVTSATKIARGRTDIDYFFVRDPDGMWIEITTDTRELSPAEPTLLEES